MPVDPADFREAMGRFATGVTVLTTLGRSGDHETLTANSLTSVSLDPVLLAVGVGRGTRWLDAVQGSGCFAVNVLSEDHESLSRACSDHARHDQAGVDGMRVSPRTGLLVVDDALAVFACEV